MKKRLRKKLKLAEFQELGFFVAGTFNKIDDPALDMFFERIIQFAEENNMQCGGGYNAEEFEIFVNTGLAGKDNEAARQKFVDFIAAAKDEIKEFEATELADAYYGDASCDCEGECHC